MANEQNLKPFIKNDSRRINKPKGAIHLSTHIQNLLNDEEFTLDNFLFNGKQFKGAPIKAIITVGIMQSLQGDNKWAEWLAKHGYGSKLIIETGDPVEETLKKLGLLDAGKTEDTPNKTP